MSILSIELATGFRDIARNRCTRSASGIHIVTDSQGRGLVSSGDKGLMHTASHRRGEMLGRFAHLHAFDSLYEEHILRTNAAGAPITLIEGRHAWLLGVNAIEAQFTLGIDGHSVVVASIEEKFPKMMPARGLNFDDLFALHGIIARDE